ncbi:DNA polymerase alpha/epsilon subunit B-domain-containing protein [Boletus edulis BED1]|uniref:DNA polymerase alpha subunit B n=1 Tax=Boletus edulis BED1 TaxID=1328754 RepID=A0AAD4GF42_BOLED|nr:DNA polymerase alpha/epsilon subunit B-domain-containing protein [Boletus edulis BED1]
MSLEESRSEIAQHFSDAVAADDTLVKECMGLCKMYNLTVESLSYKWQALSYSTTNTLAIFSLQSVPDLKAKLQQELNLRSAAGRGRGRVSGIGRSLDAGLKIGPLRPGIVKSEVPTISGPSRVVFEGPRSDEPSRKHRYMYEKVTERSEALDDRIDEFAELVQKYYRVDEFADPKAATEKTTTIVGRIVHDADVSGSEAKLNESSVVLESSRMMGSGVRVPLRFAPETKLRGGIKGVGGMSFFPGAIVALRGRNGGGGFFLVEEILTLPPLKMPPSPLSDVNAAFSMYIACGPFSLDSDLEYKPWTNLLDKVKESKPAVILLIGPFVDATNTRVKDGDMDVTPKELFERQFTKRLEAFLLQSPGTTLLLVPSINDVISDHVVFPQCELDPEFSKDPRIRLLPNPCRFSINKVSFAVTSVDTLFHLRKEEFLRRTPEVDPLIPASEPATDGMSNLARNIFQQRSFYPIFPAPLDVAHEVNLDVTRSEGTKLVANDDECVPDVLVLPSRLKHFSKVVDNTTVVNPSFLSRGTYAMLSYAGQGSGLAKDRMTADISRIS